MGSGGIVHDLFGSHKFESPTLLAGMHDMTGIANAAAGAVYMFVCHGSNTSGNCDLEQL